jgi:hypothetical protein
MPGLYHHKSKGPDSRGLKRGIVVTMEAVFIIREQVRRGADLVALSGFSPDSPRRCVTATAPPDLLPKVFPWRSFAPDPEVVNQFVVSVESFIRSWLFLFESCKRPLVTELQIPNSRYHKWQDQPSGLDDESREVQVVIVDIMQSRSVPVFPHKIP